MTFKFGIAYTLLRFIIVENLRSYFLKSLLMVSEITMHDSA